MLSVGAINQAAVDIPTHEYLCGSFITQMRVYYYAVMARVAKSNFVGVVSGKN
jgi:hypothetical protein